MTIRFLQAVPSENPEFPFQAGQVIEVACPSPYLLSLLDGVRAEVVRTEGEEVAVEPEAERAEPVRRRGRRAGA